MPLFWIVHEREGEPSVFVAQASALVTARMQALLAHHGGEFKEGHQLDARMAERVPQAMRGRTLTQQEAEKLLKMMG